MVQTKMQYYGTSTNTHMKAKHAKITRVQSKRNRTLFANNCYLINTSTETQPHHWMENMLSHTALTSCICSTSGASPDNLDNTNDQRFQYQLRSRLKIHCATTVLVLWIQARYYLTIALKVGQKEDRVVCKLKHVKSHCCKHCRDLVTLHASCGAVYCNRSCLWVCVFVGLLPR